MLEIAALLSAFLIVDLCARLVYNKPAYLIIILNNEYRTPLWVALFHP